MNKLFLLYGQFWYDYLCQVQRLSLQNLCVFLFFFFVFFRRSLNKVPGWLTYQHVVITLSSVKKTLVLKECIFPCLRHLRPMVVFTFVLSLEYTKLETMTFTRLKKAFPGWRIECFVFGGWQYGFNSSVFLFSLFFSPFISLFLSVILKSLCKYRRIIFKLH